MMVIKDSEWRYLGKEGEYFKFEDVKEGCSGNSSAFMLTKCAKYVICGCDVVLMLKHTEDENDAGSSIELTFASQRRIFEEWDDTKRNFLVGYLSDIGLPIGPLSKEYQ